MATSGRMDSSSNKESSGSQCRSGKLIDSICDEFEASWKESSHPSLAKFLGKGSEDFRGMLFVELMAIDIDYREMEGETVSTDYYIDRFPQFEKQIRNWFRDNFLTIKSPDFVISNYRVIDQLGKGGMSIVYKAEHTRLKRIVAVKILQVEGVSQREATRRFIRESEAVGKLDHPNIVRATDAGTEGDTWYIAMEYIDGIDLRKLSDKMGPLPLVEAAALIRDAAIGLHHAHEAGLIHRDIKPSNLMLSRKGEVKLLDLGLARVQWENPEDEISRTGQVMGTLDYMSPEQLDDHRVEAPTDIYGLGATFYKLLTGKGPLHSEKGSTPSQKVRKLMEYSVPDIELIRDDLPAEAVHVIRKMLAGNPNDRFASAAELVTALTPLCDNVDPGSLAKRIFSSESDSVDISPGPPVSTDSAREQVKTMNKGFSLIAIFTLVVAGFFLLNYFLQKNNGGAPGKAAAPVAQQESTQISGEAMKNANPLPLDDLHWEKSGQGGVSFFNDEITGRQKVKIYTNRGSVLFLYREEPTFEGLDLSTTFRVISGDAQLGFGLVFGYVDEQNFYAIHLQSARHFRLIRWKDGTPTELIPWTYADRIRHVYTIQSVRIKVVGGEVAILVDDETIASYTLDEPLAGKKVGLYVSDGGLSVDFWEVRLKEHGSG